jgi:hypothetical protein
MFLNKQGSPSGNSSMTLGTAYYISGKSLTTPIMTLGHFYFILTDKKKLNDVPTITSQRPHEPITNEAVSMMGHHGPID